MRTFVVLAVFVAFVVFGVCPVFGQATARVSVTSGGANGNGESSYPSISADGRYVAFQSTATNLIPGGTSGVRHIFVHDVLTGENRLASVTSSGQQGDGTSVMPCISPEGRYVAFVSQTQLVPGGPPWSIYIHDLQTRQTTSETEWWSWLPSISSDGRFLAFTRSGSLGIHVRDRHIGTTVRIAGIWAGAAVAPPSVRTSLSSDGRFLAFPSDDADLVPNDTNGVRDVFVHDLQLGTTTRVSVSSNGTEGNGESHSPFISSDGRWVAFLSDATNLVPDDTNGVRDAFVHDRQTGRTIRISVGTNGTEANDASYACAFASDGRTGVFVSGATNLIPGGTNPVTHVYTHDIQTARTVLLSVDSAGVEANGNSGWAPGPLVFSNVSVTPDGRFMAFDSHARNLVLDDTNGFPDVFVRDQASFASGTVNAGIGPVADVLFANGESRVLTVAVGVPVRIRFDASPAGPNPSAYLLFAWSGFPTQQLDLVLLGQRVGGTVNPTFFDIGQRPQPIGWGAGAIPVQFADIVFPSPVTLTLQGVIVDNGAGNPANISVTNAVILKVR